MFRVGGGADATFGDRRDVLDLRGYRSIDSSQDVLDHAVQQDESVLVDLGAAAGRAA